MYKAVKEKLKWTKIKWIARWRKTHWIKSPPLLPIPLQSPPWSNQSILNKEQAIQLARQGGIAGVGIAHRGETEYLKSIPDGSEQNNLSNLPSVSQ